MRTAPAVIVIGAAATAFTAGELHGAPNSLELSASGVGRVVTNEAAYLPAEAQRALARELAKRHTEAKRRADARRADPQHPATSRALKPDATARARHPDATHAHAASTSRARVTVVASRPAIAPATAAATPAVATATPVAAAPVAAPPAVSASPVATPDTATPSVAPVTSAGTASVSSTAGVSATKGTTRSSAPGRTAP